MPSALIKKRCHLRVLASTLAKSSFVRHVFAVAGGTAGAQFITVALAPVVTRLYGPETYGLQGIFMSIAGPAAAVAALSYPVAVVVPTNDEEAAALARLSLLVCVASAIALGIVFALLGPRLLAWLNATEIASFVYLIPLFVLFSTFGTVASQLATRRKRFALIGKAAVSQSLVVNLLKTAGGLVSPVASTLISANLLSGLVTGGILARGMPSDARGSISLNRKFTDCVAMARKYADFAYYRTPQVLLNSISHSLPALLLATYFGAANVGFYSLASAVLGLPAALIGGSFMQVFYPRINDAIRRGEDLAALIIRATLALAATGALPLALVVLAGPHLFRLAFGSDWEVAGVYGQWLSLWLFLQYINKPAVAAIPALGLQRGLLIYEIVSTSSKVLALYAGYAVFGSDIAAVALFSAVGSVAYAALIFWIVRHARTRTSGDLEVR